MKNKKKRRALIAAAFVLFGVYLLDSGTVSVPFSGSEADSVVFQASSGSDAGDNKENDAASDQAAETSAEVCELTVYISGQVCSPGVVTLPADSRLVDAINACGGFTEEADRDYLNLAEVLSDGSHIHVSRIGEETDAVSSSGTVSVTSGGIVNINTADLETLCTLPGIGEVKAQSIIRYREENGAFTCIEDIMNVSGIGEGMFSRIQDKIGV